MNMSRFLMFCGAARSPLRYAFLPAGLLLAAAIPAHAAEPLAMVQLQAAVAAQADGDERSFYAHNIPLWVKDDGALDPGAQALLQLVETAELDGLDPATLRASELRTALQRAGLERSPEALAHAELALSSALAAYAGATLGQGGDTGMIYEHDVLRPITPTSLTILRAAADAPSLEEYVRGMRWMHPLYASVRQKLIADQADASLRQAGLANLQRLRAIPAPQWSRHVVIDAAGARLWMYEGDRPVDSMKVVVGKADTQTPIMSGYIRYAVLNPYWNVPGNLVRKTIAPNVLRMGVGYLRTRGYEVLSSWDADATIVDPKTIDWKAAKSGAIEVRVRQKPGGTNAMGRVKYEFPNPQGIYLHDTPEKALLLKDVRQLSNGCIRLEDAERLGRWLMGGAMPAAGGAPEERIDLAQPVPIYVTYLTVQPEGEQITVGPDPYGHDGQYHAAAAGLQ